MKQKIQKLIVEIICINMMLLPIELVMVVDIILNIGGF